jgi:putative copper resistance protein D
VIPALAFARAIYFAATMLLFGSLAMRVLMRARLPHIAKVQLPVLFRLALPAAVLAAAGWFVLAAAQMAGDVRAALDPAVWIEALGTLFGTGFVVRLAALLLTAAMLAAGSDVTAFLLAGMALAAPALSGHAAASSPAHFTAIGTIVDALHLLTAGFWIGGLAFLAALFARKSAKADLLLVLDLFSEWAMVAVLLLVMSGLINSALVLLGEPGKVSPPYLGVLGAKLACVAVMLALAATNRFRLIAKFTAGAEARLARNVRLELGLGVFVAALAGLLGQLAPTLGN